MIKTEEITKIKKGWYNIVLKEPLQGCGNTNIQYILRIDESYAVASLKPMTEEDIDNINLDEWNFTPLKKFMGGVSNECN